MKKLYSLFVLSLLTIAATQAQDLQFFINSPSGIAGQYECGSPAAGFGGELTAGQSITGVLAPADSNEACEALVNPAEVAGKIALVDRGSCFFSDKVYFAEQAGAAGVIICNNQPGGGVIGMAAGGDYASLSTIPSAMIPFEVCEEIKAEINNGVDVEILLQVPGMYRPITNWAYSTPLEHTQPIPTLGVQIINTTAETIENAEVYCDITTPSGSTQSASALIEAFPAGLDTLVTFSIDYTPDELGVYTISYTTSYNTDIQETNFEMTEDEFATDNNGGVTSALNDGTFQGNGYVYWYASLYQPITDSLSLATHISFGIGNGDTLVTYNAESSNFVTALLYDADVNQDGTIDFNAASAESYETALPGVIGFGQYIITGGETTDDDPIFTEVINIATNEPGVVLTGGNVYYAAVEYKGNAADATRSIAFTGSSSVDYGYTSTTILSFGAGATFTGWSTVSCRARLHMDYTINSTDNLSKLDDDKVNAYPNPSAGLINVDLQLDETADEIRIDVINYNGKVVETRYFDNIQEQTLQLDITDQPNGYYFVSIKTPEGYRSIPVMVAN